MQLVTLGNRPVNPAPLTSIHDFQDGDVYVRVCLALKSNESSNDKLVINAQAFEVDAAGSYKVAPDGRPSRTEGTNHIVMPSSLGKPNAPKTHTLNPGWVVIVGDYNVETFEASAPRGEGLPDPNEPNAELNPSMQYYDTASGIGYKWVEGLKLDIARGKAADLRSLIGNSEVLSGIEF